jgi:hypothetical protein
MAKPKKKAFKKAPRIAKLSTAGTRQPRARKAKGDEIAGPGHNLTSIKKVIGPYFKRYNNLLNEKEEKVAEFTEDANALIEDAANDLGAPRSIVRMALADRRREMKRAMKERKMDPANVEALHTFQAALGGTPLGDWAVETGNEEEVSQEEIDNQPADGNPDDDNHPDLSPMAA